MLLTLALFGLVVPNGLFVYWLVSEFGSWDDLLGNHLALGFILDALMATALLAWLFARRPPGPLGWRWFLVLSLLGGLGFGIPLYLWLNFRRSDPGAASFSAWWRAG